MFISKPTESVCLVLGGGGARGPFELGVWKALRELNFSFHAVAGTSVGALNAAFVAQNDHAIAEELFRNINIDRVISIPEEFLKDGKINRDLKNLRRLSRYLFKQRGLDTGPLRQLIRTYLDEERIRASGIDFGLVTYDLSSFKPLRLFLEDIPNGRLADYLLASASHPLFRTTQIDQTRMTDGGVSDNLPFNMMKERGYRRIIAVDLSGMGRVRKPQIENTQCVYIKNSQKLDGILDFSPESSERSIRLGYLDTLRSFDRLEGNRFFIKPDYKAFRRFDEKLANPQLLPLIRSACRGLRHSQEGEKQLPNAEVSALKLIRQILPREYAKHRFVAIPLIESAAVCLDIPRDTTYSFDELLKAILAGYRELSATEPLSTRGNLRSVVRRLSHEMENIHRAGLFKLPPARYASALRTVIGRDDENLAIKMLQPLFPELPAAQLLHSLFRQRELFY